MAYKLKAGVPLPVLGLDVSKPGEFLDTRYTPDCENMELNRNIIRKRLGTTSLGSTLSDYIMAYAQLQVAQSIYVVRQGLTKTQLLDQNAGTWGDVHHAVWTGTLADKFDFAFPVLSGVKIMVITNGVDAIRKYTGTGNTSVLGGSPPLAKYMTALKNYLLLAYIVDAGTTYTARVQWCDTGAPETWTGGNSGSVDLVEDEQDISAIAPFGDFVCVHKENSIYVGYLVTTSDVWRFDRKATGVGTCSHMTVKNIPTGEQIFLARDGLHLFNGITAPLIRSPIMDELREEMNPAVVAKACAVIVRELDEYWVAVAIGSATDPDTVYKYNYVTGQCYKDTRTGLNVMGLYTKSSQLTWNDKTNTWDSDLTRWNDIIYSALNPTVLFGSTSGVSTIRTALYDDNAVAVSAFWTSKDFTAKELGSEEMGRLVRWTAIQVWAKGTSVILDYSIDGGTSWTNITTLTLTSAYPTDSAPLYGYFDVVASQIRFRFRNSTSAGVFDIKKFIIEASMREVRE